MATTYAYQKGKYGGQCGMIFPYFCDLPSNNPLESDYLNNIPAGFLRCRGQILSADQYPELANLLGVGEACIYRKEGTTLQEKDEDGTGGTFQLPDLGSKYVSAGTTPGSYNNMIVENSTSATTVYRAGVEVTLASVGTDVVFTYTGDFSIPTHTVNLSGQWTVRSNAQTGKSTVDEGQILAHGHYGTFAQLQNGVSGPCGGEWQWNEIFYYCTRDPGRVRNNPGFMRLTPISIGASEAGSATGTNHAHSNANFVITSQTRNGTMAATTFRANSIFTTVKLNTFSTTKIDSISPKFIVCEYLIKY